MVDNILDIEAKALQFAITEPKLSGLISFDVRAAFPSLSRQYIFWVLKPFPPNYPHWTTTIDYYNDKLNHTSDTAPGNDGIRYSGFKNAPTEIRESPYHSYLSLLQLNQLPDDFNHSLLLFPPKGNHPQDTTEQYIRKPEKHVQFHLATLTTNSFQIASPTHLHNLQLTTSPTNKDAFLANKW
jgi:hypothetical protein